MSIIYPYTNNNTIPAVLIRSPSSSRWLRCAENQCPPDQPPQQVEQPPRVEVVVEPVVEPKIGTEFERARRRLLERGILKETTPGLSSW